MPDDRGVLLNDQWPSILGQKLGVSTTNDGLWNGSNQRIFRKSEEFLRTTHIDKEKILAVITFPPPWRYEIPTEEPQVDYTSPLSDLRESWVRINIGHASTVDRPDRSIALRKDCDIEHILAVATPYVRSKAMMYTPEWERLEGLSQCLSIDNLFRAYGVKSFYVFSFGWVPKTMHEIQHLLPNILTTNDMCSIIGEHNSIDNFHADHQGHQIISQKLYDLLTKNQE